MPTNFENSEVATGLKKVSFIPIPKKGNVKECSNYCTVALISVQFSSVTQSCLTLCNPMNRSTPGLPVHHQLPEYTQTHFMRSVMPSSHLILCRPLLILPPIPPIIRVFSNESTLRMSWPKYWRFTLASFLPKKSQGWSPSEWTSWIFWQSKGLSRVCSNTTIQKHQLFGAQLSL